MIFSVYNKEFLTILGPSGCGKSTILSLISGLIPLTHGEIEETDGTKDSESVNSSSAIPEGTEMLPSQNNVGQYYQPDAGQQEMQQSEDGVNQDNQAQGSTNGNATQGMLDKAQQE